jgi:REP element-mobilizing transposase RayT
MDAKRNQGAHRLRRGRCSEAGRVYLVTAVTHGRRPWFADYSHGRLLVHALKYQQEWGRAPSLAFVVMPDHLHWLVQLPEGVGLSSVMQQVKGWSGSRILLSAGGHGPVWQAGFHDHALRKEEDLTRVARYIVANPLRARLVGRLGDYPLWDAVWL